MVGALAVLIVLGLPTGNMVARGAAVGLASSSALASSAFVAATPAWAVVVIAVDVPVIFSIVVQGGNWRSRRDPETGRPGGRPRRSKGRPFIRSG